MKSLKFFAAALALALAFTGCEKPVVTGVDANAPAPKDLAINAEASTSSVLVVDWDGSECVQAGAKSFVIKVNTTTELFDYKNDTDKGNFTQTIMTSEDVDIYSAKFSDLVPGEYCVRVRANYPRSIYSEWVFLSTGEDTTYTKVSLAPPVITDVEPGAKNLFVHFEGKDAEYVKKYGITGLEVQYKEASASEWTSYGLQSATTKSVTIDSGINTLTTYVVRARYINSKYSSEWAVSKEVTTIEAKELKITTAQELIDVMNGELSATEPITIAADLDFAGLSLPKGKNLPCEFEGAGHTIKNLKLTGPMFGTIASTGSVSNLTIDSSCEYTTAVSGFHAIIAGISAGKIENVTNKANLTLNYTADASALTVIGGIVAESNGTLNSCTNEGNVTMKAADGVKFLGSLVGGVCGYASSNITDCHNKGAVTVDGGYLTWASADRFVYGTAALSTGGKGLPIHCAGVVVSAATDVIGCTNSGKVTYRLTSMEKLDASIGTNCPRIAGVVATTLKLVQDCSNSGDVDVLVTLSTRGAWTANGQANNYTTKVGGVVGGQNDAGTSDAGTTDIINCHNTGNITFECDADKSYNTLGGVVAYPIPEVASTAVVKGCTNSGKVVFKGAGKTRAGGITGGSGNIEDCTNSGEVVNESTMVYVGTTSGSMTGGIVGFSTRAHVVKNCVNTGTITTASGVAAGGLVGQFGNYAVTTLVDCKVNCAVVTGGADHTLTGILAGGFGGTKAVTVGPAKVKGSVSLAGTVTELTAGNYADFLTGTFNRGDSHTITAEYGE